MDDILDTLRLLGRTVWTAAGLGWHTYVKVVDGLGKPWTMMVHSTVFGSIGSLIAKWLLGMGSPAGSPAAGMPDPAAALSALHGMM